LDRCALFVDAGYVLAEGALAVHGTRNRDSVSWDYAGLLKLLGGLSRDRTGLPLLRCYWYDTVVEGGRAAEHDTLADVPGVKLRLSKVRPSRKEGVEAEIRRDLSALARNRAVSDAVIVSAEEDLGPVIAEIQDLGIRVVLLHISADGNWAASRSLRQECDDIIDMSAGHLRPFVDLIAGAEPAGRESQLASAGYRELAVSSSAASQLQGTSQLQGASQLHGTSQLQSASQQPAIAAPAAQLYASPVTPDYERVSQAQLASPREQQARLPAQDDSRIPSPAASAGQAESIGSGPAQRRQDDQQLMSQHYQGQDAGRGLGAAAGNQAGQPGYGQNGFSADPASAGNVQSRSSNGAGSQSGLGQVAASPQGGSGPHGLLPGAAPAGAAPQNGLSQNGLPPNGMSNGLAAASQQNGLAHGGYGQPGGQQANGQSGPAQAGGPPGGLQLGPSLQPGQHSAQGGQNGMSGHGQHGGQGMQPGSGPQAGQQQGGHASAPGAPGQGLPPGHGLAPGQGAGQHVPPSQGTQPGAGMQPTSQQGQPQHGQPQQHGLAQQPGLHQQSGAGLPGQQHPLPSQGAQPGAGAPSGQPQSHRHAQVLPPGGAGGQPAGLAPLDPQRGMAPQRQIPAANGLPYPPVERGSQYGGQPGQYGGQPGQYGSQPGQYGGQPGQYGGQPGQYGGQPGQLGGQPSQFGGQPGQYGAPPPDAGYTVAPYSGPQQSMQAQQPPPVAISVGEAVQSAHAEGFGFGEAVARDAPALWLEAVLARKPRMPSDLEARLLQGSALPIDSLLHDEVRHALRRGFWDALERSRH
jgi:NYN domain-containing protein